VEEAARSLGGLGILVNNAGIALYNRVADITVEEIDALFAVNARGPILAAQAAIPHLSAGGRIITIGSAGADRIVGATGTVYYMTKSGIRHKWLKGNFEPRAELQVRNYFPARRPPLAA